MGGKQLGFKHYELIMAKREKFLAQMEPVLPRQALIDLIEPYYPITGNKGGRLPFRSPPQHA
jgi:IS5 family transposase